MRGRNRCSYQSPAAGAFAEGAREVAGDQRDAEEHRDGDGDAGDRHVQAVGVQAQPAGQDLQIEETERGVGQDLEGGVEGDQHGGHLPVTAGEVVPDQDHGDAAGQADQDDPRTVGGLVG